MEEEINVAATQPGNNNEECLRITNLLNKNVLAPELEVVEDNIKNDKLNKFQSLSLPNEGFSTMIMGVNEGADNDKYDSNSESNHHITSSISTLKCNSCCYSSSKPMFEVANLYRSCAQRNNNGHTPISSQRGDVTNSVDISEFVEARIRSLALADNNPTEREEEILNHQTQTANTTSRSTLSLDSSSSIASCLSVGLQNVSVVKHAHKLRSKDLLLAATSPSGEINYQQLAHLMSQQRKFLRERLKYERAKRKTLESLFISHSQQQYSLSTSESGSSVLPSRNKKVRKNKRSVKNDNQSDTDNTTIRSDFSMTGLSSNCSYRSTKRDNKLTVHKQEVYYQASSIHKKNGSTAATVIPTTLEKLDLSKLSRNSSPNNEPNVHLQSDGDVTPTKSKIINNTTDCTPNGHEHSSMNRMTAGQTIRDSNNSSCRSSDSWFIMVNANDTQRTIPRVAIQNNIIQPILTSQAPSLQHSLYDSRPDFVLNSERRQRQIKAASLVRSDTERQLRTLASRVAKGEQSMPSDLVLQIMSKSTTTAFPTEEMKRLTKSKYKQLPEYIQIQLNRKKRLERATNRVRAKMYKQRILHQVVTNRSVNL